MLIKKIVIDKANRLYQMPPGILALTETTRTKGSSRRTELVDLATFQWPMQFSSDQMPTPEMLEPATTEQIEQLKEELANWLTSRHGAKIVANKEIFVGGGISTLVQQLALAFIDTGDVAFIPGLGIPLYRSAITACNGEPIAYPIVAKNDWIPQFDRLTSRLGRVARLLFLNSPHNPTGAELNEKEITELAWLAGRENILLVNDAAYAGVSSRKPLSLLSIRGGKKVGVEVGSFAYLFGLPRLPFGFVVGNRDIIAGLNQTTRLIPAYLQRYYVAMAIRSIQQFPDDNLRQIRNLIDSTGAQAGKLLELLDLEPVGSRTVPFLWARINRRQLSARLARQLFKRYGILVAPGSGFGENGEGYLRFTLTAGPEAFETAAARVKKRRRLIPKGKK